MKISFPPILVCLFIYQLFLVHSLDLGKGRFRLNDFAISKAKQTNAFVSSIALFPCYLTRKFARRMQVEKDEPTVSNYEKFKAKQGKQGQMADRK